MREDRRKFVRLDSSIRVKYRILATIDSKYTMTRDLAAGGIRVEVDEEINLKTLLSLEIYLPHEQKPLEAKGEVIWQEKFDVLSKVVFETGIRFIDIETSDRNKLNQYLTKLTG